ncbi:MAG: glycosyltransferase family 2 protein [Bacteroidaceae bacterium]|nr:glycosyltransferase family 2 protein [Bacteroidaceae bacterium]
MKLSIVIVNYNVKHFLLQCLDSIKRASEGIESEVFVVDNSSTDGSEEIVTSVFPGVKYIFNKENKGFASANNQALRLAKGEYVMLLNPDTFIGEDVLREAIGFMDTHADAGALGVRMLRDNGTFAPESRRGIPTPFTSFCKMSGLCSLFPKSRVFGKYYMLYLDSNSDCEIEVVSGACMLIRRKALDKAGLLDETFFMYGEDIDLSYRILKAGYRNFYLPADILHYKGESTEKTSFRYVYVFYQAMLIFFRKHFSDYGILVSMPIKLAIYFKAFCTFVTTRFVKQFKTDSDTIEYMQKKKYLFIGSPRALDVMSYIAERYGLSADKILAEGRISDEGHLVVPDKSYDYVVYDMGTFDYKTVLRLFRTSGEKWKKKPYVGMFQPESSCILTGNIVFK